jgi:hypothetical protein
MNTPQLDIGASHHPFSRSDNVFRRFIAKVAKNSASSKMTKSPFTFEGKREVVNCQTLPYLQNDWEVLPDEKQLPNRFCGDFIFGEQTINLFLLEKQKTMFLSGNVICQELVEKRVCTANLLDYLLQPENQYRIPNGWKNKSVFFWGTIYYDIWHDSQFVRYLKFVNGKWEWRYGWLDCAWNEDCPAVVLDR